jgi:hypothetical protein
MTVVYLLLAVVVILGGGGLVRAISTTLRENRLNKKRGKISEPSGWCSIIGFTVVMAALFMFLASFNTPPKYRVSGWIAVIEALVGLSLIAKDIWQYRRFERQGKNTFRSVE